MDELLIATNPDPDSRLRYLLRLPLAGGARSGASGPKNSMRHEKRTMDMAADGAGPLPGHREERVVAQVVENAALERRRRSTVIVPQVVGRQLGTARAALLNVGLLAVGSDPDDPALPTPRAATDIVTDQSPESGAKVPAGSRVTLWIERGGGAGVREPRQLRPAPRIAREMLTEPSDEAVS